MTNEIFAADPSVYRVRTKAAGPTGSLPLTPEMLLERPSGDIFGMTQNAGMGWNPQELNRKQFLILSTQGGLRAPDYAAKDGALTVVVGRMSDEQWQALFADLGLDILTVDDQRLLRTEGGSTSRLTHITRPLWELGLANFTVEEALDIFARHGASAYRVNDYPHLFAHPQAQHLRLLTEVEGAHGPLPVLRPPWQFSEDAVGVRLPPPELGQHTDEVLREFGFSPVNIKELRASGAVG